MTLEEFIREVAEVRILHTKTSNRTIMMAFEGTTYDIGDISYDPDLGVFIIEEA